jgi:type VI secretion system secreted protein VgrG
MANYTQAGRPLAVTTPLGEDVLLLVAFKGHEAISQLFSFKLELLAEDSSKVKFDKLLGKPITITLRMSEERERYFNGICSRVSQGSRDDPFTHYRMEVVPKLWFLTKRTRSRIFQHVSVPDILKEVFEGLDFTVEIQGEFHPRDFCVQYRETDFNFASRLMEEEGIFYFFKHTADGHKMVVANSPDSHPDMEGLSTIIYEETTGGVRDEDRISVWEKTQELRSGKYTLWDHHFEKPKEKLEAQIEILETVTVGTVEHKLKISPNDKLEIYDYPGAYAQRFDGVDKGGGDQSSDLSKIHTADSERTTKIRMEQETLPGLVIQASSNCRHFVSGYKFTLQRHFDADGEYLLTGISHTAQMIGAGYRSSEGEFTYDNSFTCIPFDVTLPFVPLQVAIKPTVKGTQTATVVGPAGEEIFTDKYGRVKVQFHWDREGRYDADSSCWIRVAHPWGGKKWGIIYIPRISMEAVVDFEEGDPDRPIIVGCVYNADMMPPYDLPAEQTKSTTKTMSSKGGEGFNEIRFEDKKGQEQVFIHGEKDQDIRIKNDRREWIGNDRHLVVKRDKREEIERDEENLIKRDQIEEITRDHHLLIKGKEAIEVKGSHSITVVGDVNEKFSMNHNEETGQSIHIKAGMKIIIEAGTQISLKVGSNFIDIGPAGIAIQGTMVQINSGGAAGSGPGASPVSPKAVKVAEIADNAKPGSLENYKGQRAAMSPTQLAASNAPWHDENAEEVKTKKSWIEIVLVDDDDKPVPGEAYRITLPDGTTLAEGTLDENGFARVDGIDPGTCQVTFPDLDKDSWEPK